MRMPLVLFLPLHSDDVDPYSRVRVDALRCL
jgi:hypothetical protein